MGWLGWALIALLVLAVLVIATSVVLFSFGTVRRGIGYRNEKQERLLLPGQWEPYADLFRQGEAWCAAQAPEKVTVTSYDGLKLSGLWFKHPDAVRTVVCVNGYRSCGLRDFCISAPFYAQCGSNILIIDQRGHGDSEGNYICMGAKGRRDCVTWCEFVNSRAGADLPVFLDGISMGAATVLMAAAQGLPANVAGILADCGYTSVWEIFRHVLKSWFHLPAFPFLYITALFCRIFQGFRMKDASALEAMKKCTIPVLFVHGADDRLVPADMGRRNYEACAAPKRLIIIPGAGHAMSYLIDMPRCKDAMREFFALAVSVPEKIGREE